MSEDLIARLKAAHAALPPSPWRVRFEVSTYDGDDMEGHRDSVWVADAHGVEVSSDDEDFLRRIVLTRNALPEIIAALEERERMRAGRDRLDALVAEAVAYEQTKAVPLALQRTTAEPELSTIRRIAFQHALRIFDGLPMYEGATRDE